MVRRVIRAAIRRAAADENGLEELVGVRAELEEGIRQAVEASRDDGYSWADIARILGTTKQSAWERYGKEAS